MIVIQIIIKTWFDKTYGNAHNAKQLYISDKLAVNHLVEHGYDSYEYELIKDLKMVLPINYNGHKDKLRINVDKTECLKHDLKFNENHVVDDIDYFDLELELIGMSHVKLAKKLSVTRHTLDNWSKKGKRPAKYDNQIQAIMNEVLR